MQIRNHVAIARYACTYPVSQRAERHRSRLWLVVYLKTQYLELKRHPNHILNDSVVNLVGDAFTLRSSFLKAKAEALCPEPRSSSRHLNREAHQAKSQQRPKPPCLP